MARQTFVVTVLPNGRTPRNTLRLSLCLTPKLEQGTTLADFPDMLQWPSGVQAHGLAFQLACGTRRQTVQATRAGLRPDLWRTLFPPATLVDPVQPSDFGNRLVVSYPVRAAHSFLQSAYQAIGTAASGVGTRVLFDVLEPLVFRKGAESTLDAQLAAMRVTMWKEQNPPPIINIRSASVASVHDTMTRAALFHAMPPAPTRPDLPSSPAGFASTLDFHRALTALNAYPSLLRMLGLVFDVEVPASLCPPSPIGGTPGTISLAALSPGFAWSLTPTLVRPATSYVLNATGFAAAPGSAPAGAIAGGLLALPPNDFLLTQVELDGALLKALSLADLVAFAPNNPATGDALPSLRSGGIALAADGRAMQLLQAIRDNVDFAQAASAGMPLSRPLNAQDLVRGYRIDIWSSETGRWHSLHRRNATFRFGEPPKLTVTVPDEEGFNQLAVAQPANDPNRPSDPVATANNVPQPGTDLYLHERVARWFGWSLSVPRPALALNRSDDPQAALEADPTLNRPDTPFKMVASYQVVPGSLPQLRFGVHYRLRVRTVDLAGNSATLDVATPPAMALPAGETTTPYFRFEPISPPLVVPRVEPSDGSSVEEIVIRSCNGSVAADTIATSDIDERHIAPPRISVRLAETHGMLDDANGRLRGDHGAYDAIVARDAFTVPALVPVPELAVGYLPDPLARGAALRDLPGTEDNEDGRIVSNLLEYAMLPDVQPRPGSVTFIGFGDTWPTRRAFRLRVLESAGAPGWDAANRVLTVGLPKSAVVDAPLSSFCFPGDLEMMGVWDWLRQAFEAQQLAAVQNANAEIEVPFGADAAALITRLVLEGGHEMITPGRTLRLVHAVQQPLGRPEFLQLPVVHDKAAPILASALRNRFTPITAWRSYGSHQAVLLGGLQIHAASSAQIDLQANWLEFDDDPAQAEPVKSPASGHVETIRLGALSGDALPADGKATRFVAIYIPTVDVLWFAAPFDTLAGVDSPLDVAAPLHRFDDTKHRWVSYTPLATSRFAEYFPEPGLTLTRTGPSLLVDVPSSARPVAPDLAYVVPSFGWETQETSAVKTSVRLGGGLRIYLNRPWFSSGEDELLGVVLWPAPPAAPPTGAQIEDLKPYFTQWGNDPIWQSGSLATVPNLNDLTSTSLSAQGLSLVETLQPVDVAGYEVAFDFARGLWFCDVIFGQTGVYTPFIRLALARYQPHAITGVELSRVVLADFAQIAPDRSALLSIDPVDARRARLVIGGLGPGGPQVSRFGVFVQERIAGIDNELGWTRAAASAAQVVPDTPSPAQPDAVLWSGTIVLRALPSPGDARIVIIEQEVLTADQPGGSGTQQAGRLVYACFLPYEGVTSRVN